MAEARELRAVINAYFRHVDANDFDAVVALFESKAIYERPGYAPIDGLDQLRRFYANDRVVGSGRHQIEGVIVEADVACAWGSFSGLSRAGGELNERWCDVYEFVNAQISHRRTHFFRPAV